MIQNHELKHQYHTLMGYLDRLEGAGGRFYPAVDIALAALVNGLKTTQHQLLVAEQEFKIAQATARLAEARERREELRREDYLRRDIDDR